MADQSWLDYRPQEYALNVAKWVFARDHYNGDLLDGGKVKDYLVKKAQGETEDAYKERCALADYTNHFATVADSLAGMIAAVESDATRTFATDTAKGLGDPKDPSTVIGRLWRDADGEGNGYLTIWKLLTTDLIVCHKAWMMVDTDVNGNSIIRMFPATSVVNWRYENGVLVEVLVEELVDTRASIRDLPTKSSRYTLFTLDGWERWRKDLQTGAPVPTGEAGSYRYTDRMGQAALPIFPVQLPLRRPAGWLLAKKANAIFNKESERDHLLRHANFPRMVLSANDELFGKLTESLSKGSNVLQEDPVDDGKGHRYIAPDAASATVATEILNRKVEEFYITAFREYGDSAKEQTATEVKQDVSSGVGAFLQLLKAALDDAENGVLWRLEQTENGEVRDFVCSVERSEDFVTNDVNMVIERLRLRYFGKDAIVPIGREGRIRAAKMIAEWDGIELAEGDIESAIDTAMLQASFGLNSSLPIPAEAQAQMAVKYLVQSGQIDPTEVIDMADGTQYNLKDLVLAQARMLAEAKQQATLRQAESFPGIE